LDQACILNVLDLVKIAMDKVKSLIRKINAKIAMVRRSSRKRKFLRLLLTRELQMVKNMFIMEKPMNFQVSNQVMLLSKS
jgi:hypothetical protein